jgi:hypothetical protein
LHSKPADPVSSKIHYLDLEQRRRREKQPLIAVLYSLGIKTLNSELDLPAEDLSHQLPSIEHILLGGVHHLRVRSTRMSSERIFDRLRFRPRLDGELGTVILGKRRVDRGGAGRRYV